MSTAPNKRLTRSEVPVHMTWNLDDLFPSREAWKTDLLKLESSMTDITMYQGQLCESPNQLLLCLQAYEKFNTKLIQLGTYANLHQSEDATNNAYQEDSMLFGSIVAKLDSQTKFISSEITDLSQEEYDSFYIKLPELDIYKLMLDDIYKKKPHKLSPETEIALASIGEVTSAPYRIYQVSKGADMIFDDFTLADGSTMPNSFALYETKYEFSANAEIREKAYRSFNKTLNQYKNTYASVYATEIKKQVAMSKLRHYNSVTEMLLEPQKVSLDMYHRQMDVIYKQLAPHMRRFANLKSKQLGVDKLHFYDLKAPLDYEFNPPADYDAIKDTIIEAMKILGDDYASIMKRAFDERWIDYADNVGKSTGAFCASPYGVHSFILISYQESMRSAFTLAHELGHAGHFTLANKAQRVFNTRPSTYFVEAPSTMNEILLANHLMKQDPNPRMKRWVIMQLMGTYYHNFVTHLLEAEFQRRVYAHAENGGAITAKFLNATKLDVIKGFWGDSVEIDDDAGLTWMRQPHYYMGLYPYTYSAGLTASTAIATQIFEEGQPAVERWLAVLAAGGTETPEGLLKMAGLDVSTSEPVEKAVSYVGNLITELEVLFG